MIDRRSFIKYASMIAAASRLDVASALSLVHPHVDMELADVAGLGTATGHRIENQNIIIEIGTSRLQCRALSAGLVRVDYDFQGRSDPHTPVLDPGAKWPSASVAKIVEDSDSIELRTPRLRLEIATDPCRLKLFNSDGHPLISEPRQGGMFIDPENPCVGGLRFSHADAVPFYGIKAYPSIGPESHDTSLLRGAVEGWPQVYHCDASWGGAGGAPFLWTTQGYGLLIDSDGGFFTMGKDRLLFSYGLPGGPVPTRVLHSSGHKSTPTSGYAWRAKLAADCIYPRPNSLTFFLMVGTPEEIFASLVGVSGRAVMFPRWASGFTNSQWGIDQHELINIVDGYRAREIPIDNFAIDFDWKAWGENNFGEFRWNEKKFAAALLPPDDSDNLKNLMARRQIKITGIMKPRIIRCTIPGRLLPMTDQARSAQRAGVWYPGETRMVDYVYQQYAVLINFNLAAGRRWYWRQTWRHHAMETGLSGFWNDEADGFNNFFFMHMQQSLYQGQRELYDQRVWSINRNFYLGSQRYAYGTWSGDIPPGFASMAHQALRMQSVIGLGQAQWSMDAGNWGPPTPEQYVRWLQFGALIPLFRVHAPHKGTRLQPWLFGFRAQEMAVGAIRFRYQLAPYVYALQRHLYDTGIGVVRSMAMAFPDEPECRDLPHQWMFGPSFLAAPILKAMGRKHGESTVREIYLPRGNWIDFFRGGEVAGGRKITYHLNADSWNDLPLFVRSGSIVPMAEPVPSLGYSPLVSVRIEVFPDSRNCSTVIYDDDGSTYAYERGESCLQRIDCTDGSDGIKLRIVGCTGPYRSTIQQYLIRVHGKAAGAVTVNGGLVRSSSTEQELSEGYRLRGWTISRSVHGPCTVIKVPAMAREDLLVHLTGQSASLPIDETFYADKFILWGDSAEGRTVFSNRHPGYRGQGFIEGFRKPGASATFYVQRHRTGNYLLTVRMAELDAHRSGEQLGVYINGLRAGGIVPRGGTEPGHWHLIAVRVRLEAGNNAVTFRCEKETPGYVAVNCVSINWNPLL